MSFGKLVTVTVAGGTGMTTITIAITSTTTICMSLNAVASAVLGLIETTDQNKTTEQNERLYFIDVTTVESFKAHAVLMSYFVSHKLVA